MPRELKPEKAATKIIEMVASGDAADANDAVRKQPELQPGLKFLQHAVCEAKTEAPAPSVAAPEAKLVLPPHKPAPASRGSGPALLSRR